MRSHVAAVCLLLAFALVAGCGESEQAKAEKTVCEAKTKIASNVQSLQSLTVANASLSAVKSDVKSIGEELTKIQGVESKLSGARREQVEKANATLSEELTSLTHELTSLTLPQAQAQITAATNKLATSYKQALAPIEC
jgi:hypothetical protein